MHIYIHNTEHATGNVRAKSGTNMHLYVNIHTHTYIHTYIHILSRLLETSAQNVGPTSSTYEEHLVYVVCIFMVAMCGFLFAVRYTSTPRDRSRDLTCENVTAHVTGVSVSSRELTCKDVPAEA